MRRISLLFLVALFAAIPAFATPTCASGTLASYEALGAGGCTIGGDTVYDVTSLPGTFGNTELASSAVSIAVAGSSTAPELIISVTEGASGSTSLETMFTYDITGAQFNGISTVLSDSEEAGNGAVTNIVNFCEGGSFGPDGVDGCTQPNGGLLTLDSIQNSDSSTFGAVGSLNVTNDFVIDAGGDGDADGGTVTNSFTAAPAVTAATPEPGSAELLGLGLALVGAVRGLRARMGHRGLGWVR